MDNNLINVENLKPFPKFFYTLGIIPTSFRVSMSYEEQVLEIMRFIKDEIIPNVNQNILATKELQEKFVELVNYVNDYFESLDLQEEVNNKLDEMAESGDLAEIIAEYLQVVGLICFNTKANMKAAENLADGSFVKTFGTTTYNDGYGEFYKIRQIQNTDVIDDNNIVALTNYINLIAEKIPNATITNLINQINLINQKLNRKYIFIGDSYNTNDTPAGMVQIVPWSSKVVNYLGLSSSDYYTSGVSGSGWISGGSQNKNFLAQLQTLATDIQDKSSITDIVVLGGINDPDENNTLYAKFEEFSEYVATNFPNAIVTIGIISWARGVSNRTNLSKKMQYYNNAAALPNFRVIGNSYTWYHNYYYMQADNHPTEAGSRAIGYFLANFLKGGHNSVKWYRSSVITSEGNQLGITAESIGNFIEMFNEDIASLNLEFTNQIPITQNVTISRYAGSHYKLGKIDLHTISIPDNTNLNNIANVSGWIYDGTTYHNMMFRIRLIEDTLWLTKETATANDIVNPTQLHITAIPTINIPAEFC